MIRPGLPFGALVLALLFAEPVRADVPLPGTQPEEFQDAGQAFAPFTPSRACLQCHADFAEIPYEPYDGWAGSMMGNAAIDPVFLAALSVAEDDVPGVGDFCLRCHAPEAWLEGRSNPTDGSALEMFDDGVTCHFCHRLTTTDPLGLDANAPYVGNARYFVAKSGAMHGPYSDVTLAPHETIQEPYVSEARYCGLCHDISNPLVPWRDEAGNELGPEFPIERTYSEWLRSAFPGEGTTCQTCHMQPVEPGHSCNVAGAPDREVYKHQLAGGNTWVPQALTFMYGDDLGREALWAESVEAAREMLGTAAELAFEELPTAVAPGAPVDFSVRVTNLTGHRLPTGYPEGRRMWLEVEVRDGAGTEVFVSGTYDDEEADRLADEQLRTYEVTLGIAGQGPGFHFALNDTIYEDTRIPPRGYVPTSDDAGLEPVGREYLDGAGGIAHWDVAPYHAETPCSVAGPLTVRVRLLQQTSSREYIEFLGSEQVTPLGQERGATLVDAWEQSGKSEPFVMEEIEATIEVDGLCEPGEDAGPDGGDPIPGDDGGGGCCAVAPGASTCHDVLAFLGALGVAVLRAWRRRRRA